MDESYHSLLAAGIEKKYWQLEQDIMDDIVRRVVEVDGDVSLQHQPGDVCRLAQAYDAADQIRLSLSSTS